ASRAEAADLARWHVRLPVALEPAPRAGDQLRVVENAGRRALEQSGEDDDAELVRQRRDRATELPVERTREFVREVSVERIAAERELREADDVRTRLGGPAGEVTVLREVAFDVTDPAGDLRCGDPDVLHRVAASAAAANSSSASRSSSTPSPGFAGGRSVPFSNTSSSTVSSFRSRDSHSSAGRNSKNGMWGVTIASWAATATEIPVFQACGTISRPRAAASSQTRRASVRPPTRPTSGWATCTPPWSISTSKSCRVDNHSPAAIGTGDRADSSA